MSDRRIHDVTVPTAPPLHTSDVNQATDEGPEFDALQFLESFIQQEEQQQQQQQHDAHARDYPIENRNLAYGTHSQCIGTPLQSHLSSYHQNEFPNDNDVIQPAGDPPPRYEDVIALHDPTGRTYTAGCYRGDVSPQYNEVRHTPGTNENYPNTNRESTRVISPPQYGGAVLHQGTGGANLWSRYEYDPMLERPRNEARCVEKSTTTFCIAICVTLLCCCPVGVFAIWQASKAMAAEKRGNTRASQSSSSLAKILIFGSVLFGLISYSVLIFAGAVSFS